MLARRIIPTMLVRGRTLVKGEQFDSWRSIGHAAQAAKIHATRGVDELCILDISATAEHRGPDLKMVSELAEGCFIPITIGGGVRKLSDINALLRAGADKIAICTSAQEHPKLIPEAAARFGSQAIVGVVEARGSMVSVRCGKILMEASPVEWAKRLEADGVGEILLTSVDRDGMMNGYDLDLIHAVTQAVGVPVIASGGCGTYEHMLEAFRAGADACASGAMFAFTDNTPKEAAQYLKQQGIEVRV